jgi:hypothetical protein
MGPNIGALSDEKVNAIYNLREKSANSPALRKNSRRWFRNSASKFQIETFRRQVTSEASQLWGAGPAPAAANLPASASHARKLSAHLHFVHHFEP